MHTAVNTICWSGCKPRHDSDHVCTSGYDISVWTSETWSWCRVDVLMCLVSCRVLATYYRAQRSSDDRSTARTTMRLLESIIRLSQGNSDCQPRLPRLAILYQKPYQTSDTTCRPCGTFKAVQW